MDNFLTGLGCLFFGLVILGFVAITPIYQLATVDHMTCTVDSKERITNGESSRYMVFCDEEVLENTDALFHLKFNSADIYRDIEEGQKYDMKVYGWRVPFLSWNRNVLEIQPIEL